MTDKLRRVCRGDGFIRGLELAVRPRQRPGENLIQTVERLIVHDCLDQAGYNQRDAAELLQVTPASVCRRVRKYWPDGGYDTAVRRGIYRHGLRSVK